VGPTAQRLGRDAAGAAEWDPHGCGCARGKASLRGCWAKAQERLREEGGKDGPRERWPAQGGEKLFSFYKDRFLNYFTKPISTPFLNF